MNLCPSCRSPNIHQRKKMRGKLWYCQCGQVFRYPVKTSAKGLGVIAPLTYRQQMMREQLARNEVARNA